MSFSKRGETETLQTFVSAQLSHSGKNTSCLCAIHRDTLTRNFRREEAVIRSLT